MLLDLLTHLTLTTMKQSWILTHDLKRRNEYKWELNKSPNIQLMSKNPRVQKKALWLRSLIPKDSDILTYHEPKSYLLTEVFVLPGPTVI